MKKHIFKILLLMIITIFSFNITSFAVSFEPFDIKETKENNKTYITKIYEVDEENDALFKAGISKEFNQGNSKFELENIETKGGNLSLKKNETQIKIVETNTDNFDTILSSLPSSISYTGDDGYTGELQLDVNSIITTKVSGGTTKKSYTLKDEVEFSNYSANDLYDIPKSKTKNGVTLKLLNVEWQPQTMEYVAGSQVPVLYSGIAYYGDTGTMTVENESKFSSSAEYKGEIQKEVEQPITYLIRYVEVSNSTFKVVCISLLSLLLIGIALYFLLVKKVKIYNLQNDEYVLIDKRNINYINPIISLNNLVNKSMSNMYKIVFSKSLTKKLSGMKVKIVLNNRSIQHLVNGYDSEYSFDITI